MECGFFPATGSAVARDELSLPKAADLAVRLAHDEIDHAGLVECRRSDGAETVVFEARVAVPTQRVHDIRRRERIAATFFDGDASVPRVEALRTDFPLVPHLNLHLQEYPRSLCLYEERYEELKRGWTAPRFVQRIRDWLELTARGELHHADQGLEPLLVTYTGHIVLPHDIATAELARLHVSGIQAGSDGRAVFLAHRKPTAASDALPIVMGVYRCEPRVHGVIHAHPMTLGEVARIAEAAGLDLITRLRQDVLEWEPEAGDSKVILALVFPRARSDGGPVENHEIWCFATAQTVREVGIGLGVWEEVDGSHGQLIKPDETKRGEETAVEVLNPCVEFTREAAMRLNGEALSHQIAIASIGAGALGSQVVLNLVRAGFGRWTLMDPDRLLPHNLARHVLDGNCVGWNKAECIAYTAGSLYGRNEFVGMDVDVLLPGEKAEEAQQALSSADAVIDMTASLAVQRHLARDVDSDARRLCAFLTPSGSDLVVLAESSDRSITLDHLEMQYYRALVRVPDLAGHVEVADERHRYARSCGDTSSTMPQDLVALHGAIASRALKMTLSEGVSFLGVWRTDPDLNVCRVVVQVRPIVELELGDWTIVVDAGLRERLSELREEKLPTETGGVLLGSFDLQRKVLYLVDTLPSPPDSEEATDLYIRGCEGLREAVEDVDARTGGMLEYVGEWHSHPRGASTRPSDYDLAAFGWLTALMAGDGLPAVMMIVGDAGEMSLFVGSMGTEPSLLPEVGCGEIMA